MAYLYKIIRNGNDFSASADGGPSFFVGRRVPYEGNIGLYNIFSGSRLPKLDYRAQDFTQSFGFWAEFVEPTAICEGRNFLTLNSYDRAAFTFGFGQFAAHVPEGDFVDYLRKLLTLPDAHDYFPHLSLQNGHVHALDGLGRSTELENAQTTKPLTSYLNPTLDEVEDAEVIAAARFIHWTMQSQAAREVQVSQMVATFKSFMQRAEKRVEIDNRPAAQCCVIADILHHGRGGKMTWPLIADALRSTSPFDALLKITPPWHQRTEKLRRAIKASPSFATRTWSSARQDFQIVAMT